MLKDIIARRYSKALLSLAGADAAKIRTELDGVAAMYKFSKDLQGIMINPAFSIADRAKVVATLAADMKVSPITAKTLDLLVKKGRFRYVREMAAAYSDLLDAQEGKVKATVTSAQELTPAESAKLSEKISALVGRKVELSIQVDPSLIGGVKTRIGSTVYDGSVANQLHLVRSALLK
ncbi:MAG TPA: ATP synthase F1 subunit delta [Nitrospirota bacterium]|jgi:F-type H+-transporting ATPase subunit delta